MATSERDELKAALELLEKARWGDAIAKLEVLQTSIDSDISDQAWNFLAHAYAAIGRDADSEAMIRRSMERRGQTNDGLGEQLVGLAVVVRRQGRLEEAEGLHVQALDLLRNREPEMTVLALRNLAYLYWLAGQQDRAREIYDRMPDYDSEAFAIVSDVMKPFEEPALPEG
jgi:tetratricopeptide (TPR) repeat protein